MAFVCPALLLLVSSVCAAQTVTPSPAVITDAANPPAVTLTIKKDGGANDVDLAGKVRKVKVGDTTLNVKSDAQGNIPFTPPKNLSGAQSVQLLDDAGKPVNDGAGKPLQGQLTYPSGSGPSASPTQTPSPAPGGVQLDTKPATGSWLSLLLGIPVLIRFPLPGGDSPLIGIAFLIVLGTFVYTIARSILRSRATFRSPLGLPVGSFRAIIAYTLVAFLGFYVLKSVLNNNADLKLPEALLGIVATVIGFYFGTRSNEGGSADADSGIVRGVVRKDGSPAVGAEVKFKLADGKVPYTRITDVDGRFVLEGAKSGKYEVSATAAGASAKQDITVTEGSDQEIALALKGAATGGGQGGGETATGSIQGTVKLPGGKGPAAGANVVLSLEGVDKGTAQTDKNGKFTVGSKLADGDYDVAATLTSNTPGEKPATAKTKVTVKAGAAPAVELTLTTTP
ncbi:MAG TPA: carboxypeptidase-like regulatory domain-containing protein [Pyrinomonadaceae bacterium]|jgi:hypothetical protein